MTSGAGGTRRAMAIEAAQRKADDLNDQLVEQEALLDASRPHYMCARGGVDGEKWFAR